MRVLHNLTCALRKLRKLVAASRMLARGGSYTRVGLQTILSRKLLVRVLFSAHLLCVSFIFQAEDGARAA